MFFAKLRQKVRVAELIWNLKSRDPDLRSAAAWVLGKIGPDAAGAVPALKKALEDPDPRVRGNASVALGLIRPADQVEVARHIEQLKEPKPSGRADEDIDPAMSDTMSPWQTKLFVAGVTAFAVVGWGVLWLTGEETLRSLVVISLLGIVVLLTTRAAD
jgi:hypothetical protein